MKKRRATYEDLLAVPAHLVAELINGVLITNPRPASRHALASSVLGSELVGPFHRGKGGPGGWIILDEPELHLHGDILVPDLAGWRRERMPELPDAPAFELAPDWACEVLSPSTAAIDRAEKMPVYAREGVSHVWLVDPIARTLEAFRFENARWWCSALGATMPASPSSHSTRPSSSSPASGRSSRSKPANVRAPLPTPLATLWVRIRENAEQYALPLLAYDMLYCTP